MLTQKDYCDYDTCVALEEVGMLLETQIVRSYAKEGIQTSKIYPNRPSLYEAQKWLREVKKIFVDINTSIDLNNNEHFNYTITFHNKRILERYTSFDWDYEDALLEGIKEAIKILKEETI